MWAGGGRESPAETSTFSWAPRRPGARHGQVSLCFGDLPLNSEGAGPRAGLRGAGGGVRIQQAVGVQGARHGGTGCRPRRDRGFTFPTHPGLAQIFLWSPCEFFVTVFLVFNKE